MRGKHQPEQVPDYQTGADIPQAARGSMLYGDPQAQLATQRQDAAQHVDTTTKPPEPQITVVRAAANERWNPMMIAIPAGVAVEIIGRDDDRETFDVTNQSKAITGFTALLFLFADEQTARSFADDSAAIQAQALANGIRMNVLPDGAGRTFTHTASMWAVAYAVGGGANGVAVLDVSAERRSRYRR
jgi:hypothetical protein